MGEDEHRVLAEVGHDAVEIARAQCTVALEELLRSLSQRQKELPRDARLNIAVPRSQNTAFMHGFEKLVAVSIVDIHSDEHRAGRIESLVQRWCDLIWTLDAKAGCAEGFGIFHRIDRAEIGS